VREEDELPPEGWDELQKWLRTEAAKAVTQIQNTVDPPSQKAAIDEIAKEVRDFCAEAERLPSDERRRYAKFWTDAWRLRASTNPNPKPQVKGPRGWLLKLLGKT
jgi:hypothetical protein